MEASTKGAYTFTSHTRRARFLSLRRKVWQENLPHIWMDWRDVLGMNDFGMLAAETQVRETRFWSNPKAMGKNTVLPDWIVAPLGYVERTISYDSHSMTRLDHLDKSHYGMSVT